MEYLKTLSGTLFRHTRLNEIGVDRVKRQGKGFALKLGHKLDKIDQAKLDKRIFVKICRFLLTLPINILKSFIYNIRIYE